MCRRILDLIFFNRRTVCFYENGGVAGGVFWLTGQVHGAADAPEGRRGTLTYLTFGNVSERWILKSK